MAEALMITERAHPLAGRRAAGADVEVLAAPPAFRVSLRCGADAMGAVSKALGLPLPDRPKTSATKTSSTKGSRAALWLGPDEWLVISDTTDPMTDLAGVDACSAVDVSHRNTAIVVEGSNAADLIAHGCPQNLSLEAFPVGACSRTVLGKAEIVLYRPEENRFHIEVWRSFSDYAFTYLADAARDVG